MPGQPRRVMIDLDAVRFYLDFEHKIHNKLHGEGKLLVDLLNELGIDPNEHYRWHCELADAKDRAVGKKEFHVRGRR